MTLVEEEWEDVVDPALVLVVSVCVLNVGQGFPINREYPVHRFVVPSVVLQ
ncbi:MAG: hypothetical protein ACP5Q4_01510 [Candidatus Caldatribacteriaceae bacterium]